MCIICVKKPGIALPSPDTFRNCFSANSDGAGFAYAREGILTAHKGLMTIEAFEAKLAEVSALYDTAAVPMIFHFRIGTHGSKSFPGHTHPFPIIDDTEGMISTDFTADRVLFHNGIITFGKLIGNTARAYTEHNSGPSDSMELAANILAPLYKLSDSPFLDPKIAAILEQIISYSKLAILDKSGNIDLFGAYEEGEDGLVYSNTTYLPPKPKADYKPLLGWKRDNFDDGRWSDDEWNAWREAFSSPERNEEYIDNLVSYAKLQEYLDQYKAMAFERERKLLDMWRFKESGYDEVLDKDMYTFYNPYKILVNDNKTSRDGKAKTKSIQILCPFTPWYTDRAYTRLYWISETTGRLIDAGKIVSCHPMADYDLRKNVVGWRAFDYRLWNKTSIRAAKGITV